MTRVFLSCGEASGDLYAGELIESLEAKTRVECFGLGGPAMERAGAELVVPLDEVSVIGLVEVVAKLPALRRTMARLVSACEQRRPDVAVLIDFSGFNLRLARRLHAMDIPIVYYVSPQVWAWRQRRAATIRALVRKMLVLLPFEEAFYRQHGVPVRHVGHPLVDRVQPSESAAPLLRRLGLNVDEPYLMILPGSRRRELDLHMPVLAQAIVRLGEERPGLQFVVSRAPWVEAAHYAPLAQLAPRLPVALLEGDLHTGLAHASAAIIASGTATLETALCGTPMVVVYRVGWASYLLGRPFVRVPHFAMVNLIAESRVVPELIQSDMSPDRIVSEVTSLLGSETRLAEQRQGLAAIRDRLGPPGASGRAADEILEVAREQQA